MKLFRLAVLDIVRRPLASFMLIVSIALSVAAASLLFRLFLIAENRFDTLAAGGDAIIGAKSGEIDILLSALNNEGNYPGFLPVRLFQSLRTHQTVQFEDGVQTQPSFIRSVVPIVLFAQYRNYRAIGTDESFYERPRIEDSVKLVAGKLPGPGKEVVVGAEIARREGLSLSSTVDLTRWEANGVATAPEHYTVVGILAPTSTAWDFNLFSTVSEAQRVLATQPLPSSIWGNEVLNYFLVYLTPDGLPKLEALINNRSVGQSVAVVKTIERLKELTGVGERLGFSIVGTILFLGGLSICAVLISRYEGLSIQTAIMRALGFQKNEVLFWLVSESLLIAIIALLIGGFTEGLTFEIFHTSLGTAIPTLGASSVNILDLWPIWLSTLLGTLIGTCLPMIGFYRQDIHNSLRGL